ncbi:MAG TPA: hypothetical protein VFN19_07525, partial [Candidatus Nanopelagicales bacterium]|nr:hypothetical protein [Candidatus Nanopelagicales bacterium]
RTSIGADSLGYVSLEGLVGATGVAMDRLCRACFDGVYPVPIPDPEVISARVLEGMEHRVLAESAGASSLLGGAGAGDALTRP